VQGLKQSIDELERNSTLERYGIILNTKFGNTFFKRLLGPFLGVCRPTVDLSMLQKLSYKTRLLFSALINE
jgi:hypothetical protein